MKYNNSIMESTEYIEYMEEDDKINIKQETQNEKEYFEDIYSVHKEIKYPCNKCEYLHTLLRVLSFQWRGKLYSESRYICT